MRVKISSAPFLQDTTDFQETKEPLLSGIRTASSCISMMKLTFAELEVNEDALRRGFSADIFATDAALELVAKGMSFREAYREIGLDLGALSERDPDRALRARTSTGSPGNLRLDVPEAFLEELAGFVSKEEGEAGKKFKSLSGLTLKLH